MNRAAFGRCLRARRSVEGAVAEELDDRDLRVVERAVEMLEGLARRDYRT